MKNKLIFNLMLLVSGPVFASNDPLIDVLISKLNGLINFSIEPVNPEGDSMTSNTPLLLDRTKKKLLVVRNDCQKIKAEYEHKPMQPDCIAYIERQMNFIKDFERKMKSIVKAHQAVAKNA